MASYYFERECRTPNSECYTVLEDGNPAGRLDLHYTPTMVHATLIVSERITQEAVQELITTIDEDLIDAVGIERDEFVVHVHQGRDLGVWSNNEFGPPESEGQPQEGA